MFLQIPRMPLDIAVNRLYEMINGTLDLVVQHVPALTDQVQRNKDFMNKSRVKFMHYPVNLVNQIPFDQ